AAGRGRRGSRGARGAHPRAGDRPGRGRRPRRRVRPGTRRRAVPAGHHRRAAQRARGDHRRAAPGAAHRARSAARAAGRRPGAGRGRIMSEGFVRVRGVCRTYRRGGETLRVLGGLDLSIAEGAFYALMGPSGSGKSTLLNLIGGLDRPDAGEVVVAGQDLGELDENELAAWRAEHVGFVFQGFNLLPVLTARENVELPRLLSTLNRSQRRGLALRA